jgi:hypothetical protein
MIHIIVYPETNFSWKNVSTILVKYLCEVLDLIKVFFHIFAGLFTKYLLQYFLASGNRYFYCFINSLRISCVMFRLCLTPSSTPFRPTSILYLLNFVNIYIFLRSGRVWPFILILDLILSGLSLPRLYAWCHYYCELSCTAPLACSEPVVLPSSTASGSYNVLKWSMSLESRSCNRSVSFRTSNPHSLILFSLGLYVQCCLVEKKNFISKIWV